MDIYGRVGVFMLILGIGVLYVFGITVDVGTPVVNYFCWGISILMLGVWLIVRNRQPKEKPERFKWLNRLLSRRDDS